MKMYYNDPLIAAYMAREFGVECYCLYTDEEREDYDEPNASYDFGDAELSAETWQDVIGGECRRMYVAEDSLPIFSPRTTDLFLPDHAAHIIWRDGKNFFMPQVGND